MWRFFLASGATVMAVGVALGAVASHHAKLSSNPDAVRLLQIAVMYQFIHGIGIVIAGMLARANASRWIAAMGWLHLAGVVAFCGSLYVLAFTGVSLGIAAPLGGVAFIAGWLALAGYAITSGR